MTELKILLRIAEYAFVIFAAILAFSGGDGAATCMLAAIWANLKAGEL